MSQRTDADCASHGGEKTEADECFVDSGMIDSGVCDSGLVSERHDKDVEDERTTVSVKFDSGVDVGLAESFNELNIQNDPESEVADVAQILNIEDEESDREPESWEIYFRQDDAGDTQLHVAIVHELPDAVRALLHMCPHPALLDVRNDSGRAPLHLAVLTSQPHIARRLLIAGAKVNTRDADGNTALHLASHAGDLSCLRALTAPLAPALHPASAHPLFQPSRAKTLPQALDQKNYDGETCVHLAAMRGHIDILKHLIWFGADINARENKSGRTALHIAIESGNVELFKFLMTECALDIRTYSGHTALQLGNYAIRKQLLAAGYVPSEDEFDFESESESDDDYDDNNEIQYSQSNYFNSGLRTGEVINVA